MKIKKEFWELIKENLKTIELRKTGKFKEELLDDIEYEIVSYPDEVKFNIENMENDRLEIWLFDEEKIGIEDAFLGTIKINGYQIIKNPFKEKLSINGFNIKSNHTFTYDKRKELMKLLNIGIDETDWIIKYWDWLTDYFKDEPEILVLKVEKFEEVGD